jgi:hypothetical protein
MIWKSISKTICFLCVGLFMLSVPHHVSAAVTVYSQNLTGFNTAAGSPPITIDFDTIASGTNITGNTISGVTFLAPVSSAPLIVVRGSDTYTPAGAFSGTVDINTNKLYPTSGQNVLSPGGVILVPGPNNAVEKDDLELVFASSVSAFGFDHLSQSADGASYTLIAVYSASNALLYSGTIPISNIGGLGGGAPGGADFWGVVSDQYDIKRIVISENDGNAQYPDCNIGFDTFRFFTTTQVPEPTTMILLGFGLVGLAGVRRFRK